MAATPAAADPAEALLAEMRETCAASGDRLVQPGPVWAPLDLGPEAPAAAAFFTLGWDCAQRPGMFWGTGGGELILRAGDAVWQGTVRDWTVIDFADKRVVLLSRHGSFCGAFGYQPCVEALLLSEGRWLTVSGADPAD